MLTMPTTVEDVNVITGGSVNINLSSVFNAAPSGSTINFLTPDLSDGSNKPSWLTWNSSTKILSGTAPTSVGIFNMRIYGYTTTTHCETKQFTFNIVV